MGISSKNNASLAINLLMIVVGMLLLTAASVPLYRLFCQVTGYGGTTREGIAAPQQVVNRTVRVTFNADTAPGLPWEFRPLQHEVRVRVGEQVLVHYEAINRSTQPVKGHAVYNVLPFAAGSHFVKIECFCFQEQTLAPGQRVDMPVLFYLDPALVDDAEMDNVQTITLSYTFFPVKTGASAIPNKYATTP